MRFLHKPKSSPEESPFYLEASLCLPDPDNALLEEELVPAVDFLPFPTLQPQSVNLLLSKKKNYFKKGLLTFLKSRNGFSFLFTILPSVGNKQTSAISSGSARDPAFPKIRWQKFPQLLKNQNKVAQLKNSENLAEIFSTILWLMLR